MQNQTLKQLHAPPPNASHSQQLHFYSTKKKRQSAPRWSKSSSNEYQTAHKKYALLMLNFVQFVVKKMTLTIPMKYCGSHVPNVICGCTNHALKCQQLKTMNFIVKLQIVTCTLVYNSCIHQYIFSITQYCMAIRNINNHHINQVLYDKNQIQKYCCLILI